MKTSLKKILRMKSLEQLHEKYHQNILQSSQKGNSEETCGQFPENIQDKSRNISEKSRLNVQEIS